MKNQKHFSFPAVVLGLLLAGTSLHAQTGGGLDLSWNTFDGGGGASTGGTFSLVGTIGQPDAGVSTGGNFTLTGGFWGLFGTARVAAPPTLTITLVGAYTIVLSWSAPAGVWQLQQCVDLTPDCWADFTNTAAQTFGDQQQVFVPVDTGQRFYRLRR